MNGNHIRKIRNPRTVLDLATGKGAWAVDIAQEFATADEVVGVDIKSSAPIIYPSNCRFETGDVCKGIRYPANYFSFVHSRAMKTVVVDWPSYLADIFRVTASGGHIQLTEMAMTFASQNGSLGNDSGLKVMERTLQKYALIKRFDFQIGSKLSALVESAGFHSVEEKVVKVPIGGWQSESRLVKVGTLMMEHLIEAVGVWERHCMVEIGVPEDTVDMYIEKVRRELKDPRYQLTVMAYYVTARKPGRSRSSSPKGLHSPKRRSPPSSPKRG